MLTAATFAEVTVKTEQLNPADPTWKFKTIPGPSKSDIARGASVTIDGNQWDPAGGKGLVLVNGRLPSDPNELSEEAFLSNGNANDGSIVIDLGRVQPVAAVATYSWHEYDADQSARGPQVYTLSGSGDSQNWAKIAAVDTRPNKTGAKWSGQHGAFIADTTGKLGEFRYLKFAVQRTRSPLQPDVRMTGTLFAEIDVHTAATLAKAGDADVAGQQVKEIIVVCKTHFDIGYTHRVKDLMQYYRTTMIDRALGLMDKSKELPTAQQFIWTSPGWVMEKVLEDWPGQTPERRQRIEAAFKSGKFVTHAMPFTIEAELMEAEEFARGYMFADTVSRKYGLPLARGAKTTDVPSQSPSLATGLAHGDVKFMHIGCNWPSGYIHDLPPLFWWEGPDGSRVMTQYSPCYGTSVGFGTEQWPGPNMGWHFIPPANWPYKTWAAILVTGDNSGPPDPNAVKAYFAEVAKKMPNVKIRMGTMEEFADAILAEKVELPVVKGEMPDTWIHGAMCDPGGMRIARDVRPLMPAVEALNTQLRHWGVSVADPAKELARAYEQSLLYNEHTWGGAAAVNTYGEAFQKLPPDKFNDLEGSWEDKTDYIRTAGKITTSLLATNLAALAQAVNRAGPRVVVYNPLPWTRTGIIEIPGQSPFLAENIPASGYKTFPVSGGPRSVVAAGDTLENEFFKVKLDPAHGTIASLVDKRTGREWVDASAVQGLGQYLNERFSLQQTADYCRAYQQERSPGWLHTGMYKPGLPGNVPYRDASGRNGKLNITRNGLTTTAVMDMPGDATNYLPATSLRVTLHRGQPYLDLELTIKDKAKDNWPEADWLCLPFKINDPQFRVGRNLGVMNPATDILKGANRHLYAVGTGVTITGLDGAGIAVCPLDHPLISLDTPGMWKFSLDFVPKKPVIYLNLYNNQWNTNYRYWYAGTWSSRVRLWTFSKNANFIPSALEARLPLQASVADGPAGKLPAKQSGLSVSRKGVLVTALTPSLLRVWEQAGVSGELVVTGLNAKTATPTNLRGEKTGAPLQVRAGNLTFNLRAYAPASFILE